MNSRNRFARAIAMLAIPLCLAACVADTTEPSEPDTTDIAANTQELAAVGSNEEVALATGDDAIATKETNAGGCISYVGVVTVKEYECPCWTTYYYDRFYNSCTGTTSDSFLYEKSTCNTKYGYICP